MSWARLDDRFFSHPKLAELGPYLLPCVGLHCLAISYANFALTDGWIAKAQVPRLAGDLSELLPEGHPWKLVQRLVLAKLWHEHDGDYRIHDFLVYNKSRRQVLQERRTKVLSGQAGGQASAQARAQAGAQANGHQRGKRKSTPVPVPVPVPKRQQQEAPPPWAVDLPWTFHPTWWQAMRRLFPDVDHEAVCRDAAAYWLEHPGKYRSASRFLRSQFARAFARRRTDDPYATLTAAWECATCGEVHEGPQTGPRTCPRR